MAYNFKSINGSESFDVNDPITGSHAVTLDNVKDYCSYSLSSEIQDNADYSHFLVKKSSLYTGDVFGYSSPDMIQWSNLPAFYPGSWRLYLNYSDALIAFVINIPISYYTTFEELVNAFNTELAVNNCPYRLRGNSGTILVLTQLDGTTLIQGDTDAYFLSNTFNFLEIEIEDVSAGFLIKGTNPKPFSVVDAELNIPIFFFKPKDAFIPSLTTILVNDPFPINPYYKQEVREILPNVDRWYYFDGTSWVLTKLFLKNPVVNATIAQQQIIDFSMFLELGWYRVLFTPLYDVNQATTGTGWNFQGGSATIQNYSFRSIASSTSTVNYENNYASKSQDYTTAQTSRTTNNRASIEAMFEVTVSGTIIPHFRAELAGAQVTLKRGSLIEITKLY